MPNPKTITVTLLDLEGDILEEFNTAEDASFKYCSITTYEDSGGYYCTELKHCTDDYHRASKELWDDGLPYEKRVLQYKLVDFINDQLTFIRNGMWETLAIYQATLGRYTEVPWYPFDPKKNDIVEKLGFDKFTPLSTISNGYYYDKSPKHNSIWHPRLSEFLTYYTDVFSHLTPWEGATHDHQ